MKSTKSGRLIARSAWLLLLCFISLTTVSFDSAASGSQPAPIDVGINMMATADLTTSEASADNFSGGDYDIGILNKGPDTAQNVMVTFPIPAGATFSRVLGGKRCTTPPSGGTGDIVCALGDIPANGQVSVNIILNLTATPGTTIKAQALVSSDTFDPNPGDNVYAKDYLIPPHAQIDSVRTLSSPFRIEITGQSIFAPHFFLSGVGIGCDCELWPFELAHSPQLGVVILEGGSKLKKKFPKGVPTKICYQDFFYNTVIQTEFTR